MRVRATCAIAHSVMHFVQSTLALVHAVHWKQHRLQALFLEAVSVYEDMQPFSVHTHQKSGSQAAQELHPLFRVHSLHGLMGFLLLVDAPQHIAMPYHHANLSMYKSSESCSVWLSALSVFPCFFDGVSRYSQPTIR